MPCICASISTVAYVRSRSRSVSIAIRYEAMTVAVLRRLVPGQLVPFGGNRVATVPDELAAAFVDGDRLVVVHDTGDLLHIPRAEHERVHHAVGAAAAAFT